MTFPLHRAPIALSILVLALAYSGATNLKSHGRRSLGPRRPAKHSLQIRADLRAHQQQQNDPRVAFVELSHFVHVDNPMRFDDLCRMISDQTEDTRAVFDKPHGFLQIVWGSGEMNEALAYFASSTRNSGIFLYAQSDGLNSYAFAYRN